MCGIIALHTSRKGNAMGKDSGIKPIAQNRKAYHDYFVLEKLEAGLELF